MLPFDCLDSIFCYCKTHKGMVALMSTNSYYRSFLYKMRWNKEPVHLPKALDFPFYDNIEHMYFSRHGCLYPPKHLREITVRSTLSNKASSESVQFFDYLKEFKPLYPLKVHFEKGVSSNVINLLLQIEHITNVSIAELPYNVVMEQRNIETLSIHVRYNMSFYGDKIILPTQVKNLKINTTSPHIFKRDVFYQMKSLIHLEIFFYDMKVDFNDYKLPQSTKKLVSYGAYLPTRGFPEGIEEIIFRDKQEFLCTKTFPDSAKRLSFLKGVDSSINGSLPPNLEYLYIGGTKTVPLLADLLPKTLKELVLDYGPTPSSRFIEYTF